MPPMFTALNQATCLNLMPNTMESSIPIKTWCLQRAIITVAKWTGNHKHIHDLTSQMSVLQPLLQTLCKAHATNTDRNGEGHFLTDAIKIVSDCQEALECRGPKLDLGVAQCLWAGGKLRMHVAKRPKEKKGVSRFIVLDAEGFIAGDGVGHYWAASGSADQMAGMHFSCQDLLNKVKAEIAVKKQTANAHPQAADCVDLIGSDVVADLHKQNGPPDSVAPNGWWQKGENGVWAPVAPQTNQPLPTPQALPPQPQYIDQMGPISAPVSKPAATAATPVATVTTTVATLTTTAQVMPQNPLTLATSSSAPVTTVPTGTTALTTTAAVATTAPAVVLPPAPKFTGWWQPGLPVLTPLSQLTPESGPPPPPVVLDLPTPTPPPLAATTAPVAVPPTPGVAFSPTGAPVLLPAVFLPVVGCPPAPPPTPPVPLVVRGQQIPIGLIAVAPQPEVFTEEMFASRVTDDARAATRMPFAASAVKVLDDFINHILGNTRITISIGNAVPALNILDRVSKAHIGLLEVASQRFRRALQKKRAHMTPASNELLVDAKQDAADFNELYNFSVQVTAAQFVIKMVDPRVVAAFHMLGLTCAITHKLEALATTLWSSTSCNKVMRYMLWSYRCPTPGLCQAPLPIKTMYTTFFSRVPKMQFCSALFDRPTVSRSFFQPQSFWVFWARQEHPHNAHVTAEHQTHYAYNNSGRCNVWDVPTSKQWWVHAAREFDFDLTVFGRPTNAELAFAVHRRLTVMYLPDCIQNTETVVFDQYHFQVGPKFNRVSFRLCQERRWRLLELGSFNLGRDLDSRSERAEVVATLRAAGVCRHTRATMRTAVNVHHNIEAYHVYVPTNVNREPHSCSSLVDNKFMNIVDDRFDVDVWPSATAVEFSYLANTANRDAIDALPDEYAEIASNVHTRATMRDIRDATSIRGLLSRSVAVKYQPEDVLPAVTREQVDDFVNVVSEQSSTLLHGAGNFGIIFADQERTPQNGVKACYFCNHPFVRGEKHRHRVCQRCNKILHDVEAPCFITEGGMVATLGLPYSAVNVGPVVYRALDVPLPNVETYDLNDVFLGKYDLVRKRIASLESAVFHKAAALYGFGTRFAQNAAPRGERSILQAVIVRVARKTNVEPEPLVFKWALEYFKWFFDTRPELVHPDDRARVPDDEWLTEVSNRPVMAKALEQLKEEGLEPLRWKLFTKAEKSAGYDKICTDEITDLGSFKPRAIQAMPITWQAYLGPYVKAVQRKIARVFNSQTPVFYAGKATPSELNEWLNRFVVDTGDHWFIMIDYSMFDNTHSHYSFEFLENVYAYLVDCPQEVLNALYKMRVPRGRAGSFKYRAPKAMNGSGRPDTSLANIVNSLAALINLSCVLMTGTPADEMPFDRVVRTLEHVMLSANGDDSLLRVPKTCHVQREDMPAVVQKQIARFGFIATSDKQLITDDPSQIVFLGNTIYPVSGKWYWGPTLGRRLPKHHVFHEHVGDGMAWLNGVAKMERLVYPHVPVLSDMAQVVTDQLAGCKSHTTARERKERYHKANFELVGLPSYTAETISFVERRYKLAPGELSSLIELVKTCTVPCVINHPVLDRLVAHDDS